MMCNSTQKVLTFRSTLRKAMENKYANWLIPEDLTWRKVFFKGQAMHPKMSDSCLCRKRKRKKGINYRRILIDGPVNVTVTRKPERNVFNGSVRFPHKVNLPVATWIQNVDCHQYL